MLITYTLKQFTGASANASGIRDATRYINGLIAAVIGKFNPIHVRRVGIVANFSSVSEANDREVNFKIISMYQRITN